MAEINVAWSSDGLATDLNFCRARNPVCVTSARHSAILKNDLSVADLIDGSCKHQIVQVNCPS
jgi:hypothetical protein